MKNYFFILFFFILGCSSLPEIEVPLNSNTSWGTQSMKYYESLHFKVSAYSYENAIEVSKISEEIYNRIMQDLNLLSFRPKNPYPIIVYQDQEEYHRSTGYPGWSGGATVSIPLGSLLPAERESLPRSIILTYETILSPAILSHEITHLVFNEFMEFSTREDSSRFFWINEGLATYEENQTYQDWEQNEFAAITQRLVKENIISLDRVMSFYPVYENQKILGEYSYKNKTWRFSNIDIWYWQVSRLCGFMIERKGKYNFSVLLQALKSGKEFQEALVEAYIGQWRNLQDLEREWKNTL